jgi:hypothetical protein
MVDTDQALSLGLSAVGLNHIKVDQREPVVLIVVGQESQYGVLVLDLGVKYELIPRHHLIKAVSPVYDVNKFLRADTCHDCSPLAD